VRAIVLAIVVLVTGCVQVAQEVTFTSDPPGATVLVGTFRAITPVTLALPLNADQRVRFELDGYQPVDVTLEREFTWIEEATYQHDHWYGRLPMTRTELDIFLLPYRLLVGTAWRFYPEVGVGLIPKEAKKMEAAPQERR